MRSAGLPARLFMGLFIIFVYGRAIEVTPLRALPILEFLLLAYGLLTSRWMDWIPAKPTVLLLALTAWMALAALCGEWPGGSVSVLTDIWSRSMLCYLIVVSLGRGLAGVGTAMSSMAWSVAAIALTGLFDATMVGGRLAVGPATLSNPNDLAAALVIGLPFCAWYVLGSGRLLLMRVIMAAVTAVAFVMLLQTGSRMGLLGLLCVGIVLLSIARGKLRLLLVLATLGTGLGTVFFLPEGIQQRYATMVDKDVESPGGNLDAATAIGSSEARWTLLVNSLQVTLRHPLLGVGPGLFTVANAGLTKKAGGKANWQLTHNSYTQVSSECGIPAVVIFAGLVIYCLRTTNRLRKAMALHPELRFQAPMPFWLLLAVAAYALCAAFGCFAYAHQLPLLAAIIASLEGATAGALAQPASSAVPARRTA